jgi:hypothetical protein
MGRLQQLVAEGQTVLVWGQRAGSAMPQGNQPNPPHISSTAEPSPDGHDVDTLHHLSKGIKVKQPTIQRRQRIDSKAIEQASYDREVAEAANVHVPSHQTPAGNVTTEKRGDVDTGNTRLRRAKPSPGGDGNATDKG